MRFSLNIDHVATVRNARGERQPDPIAAAILAEQSGIDGIVVHLREDRRHVNDRDVRLLRELITTKLDLEMAAVEEIIGIACDVGPDLVTLVPEHRAELTTEGGLNVIDQIPHLKAAIETFHKHNMPVSIFIEPQAEQIDAAAEIATDMIEIHTGVFANAASEEEQFDELEKIQVAVRHAKKLGLGVNAGHGLNYTNMKIFRELKDIDEVSIGHAVIARAMFTGLEKAIKEMFAIIHGG